MEGGKIMSANRYIRFVELSSGLIRDPRISLYSSKYSKKIYTQHQLLVLLIPKEYLSEDYRDIVELTEIMDSLLKEEFADLKQGRFIIDVENTIHGASLQFFGIVREAYYFVPYHNSNIIIDYTIEKIPRVAI